MGRTAKHHTVKSSKQKPWNCKRATLHHCAVHSFIAVCSFFCYLAAYLFKTLHIVYIRTPVIKQLSNLSMFFHACCLPLALNLLWPAGFTQPLISSFYPASLWHSRNLYPCQFLSHQVPCRTNKMALYYIPLQRENNVYPVQPGGLKTSDH